MSSNESMALVSLLRERRMPSAVGGILSEAGITSVSAFVAMQGDMWDVNTNAERRTLRAMHGPEWAWPQVGPTRKVCAQPSRSCAGPACWEPTHTSGFSMHAPPSKVTCSATHANVASGRRAHRPSRSAFTWSHGRGRQWRAALWEGAPSMVPLAGRCPFPLRMVPTVCNLPM